MTTAEQRPARRRRRAAGARWGPYLAERAWGTVREDYSPRRRRRGTTSPTTTPGPAPTAGTRTASAASATTASGCAWRSRSGTARDPILKERIFGLTGNEGNHGEDAKEYWWFLDSTPTHSWMRWRYLVPAGASSPTPTCVAENRRRGRLDPEYELLDTGVFDDDRYWDITVDYAKADARRHLHPADGPQRRARRRHPRRAARRCGSATRGRGASTTAGRRSSPRTARSSPSTTPSAG